MPSPFYNGIKGTCTAGAGTGAFTPTGAASNALAWSTVPAGWMGLVRYEDGSAWELQYSYWDGSTLTRSATTQFVASSTGSGLTLGTSATAAMVPDGGEVMTHLASMPWVGWFGAVNTSVQSLRGGTLTEIGTAAGATIATTNQISEHPRRQYTSATTANAQCGWASPASMATYNPSAGRGGFEYVSRFGFTVLPTGPRLFAGATSATYNASTAEPSALNARAVFFGKDSTDTFIQFMVNDATAAATKTSTGMNLVTGTMYEASVWMDPGGTRAYGLLFRFDSGSIWYGSTTTGVPSAAATLRIETIGALSGTTGTAAVLHMASMMVRGGY